MSLGTVIGFLAPLARQMRTSILPGGGDPALLFNAVVEAGLLVAAADGDVDRVEIGALARAVRTLTEDDMAAEDVESLLVDLVELRASEGEAARCTAVGSLLASAGAAEEGTYLAAAIAHVSGGGLDASELKVIDRIAKAARLDAATTKRIVAQVRDEIARRSVIAPPPV